MNKLIAGTAAAVLIVLAFSGCEKKVTDKPAAGPTTTEQESTTTAEPTTTIKPAETTTTAVPTTTAAPPTTVAPPTTERPTTTEAPAAAPSAYYANCAAARAAGVTPLHRGDPGYAPKLDRDGDGIACE